MDRQFIGAGILVLALAGCGSKHAADPIAPTSLAPGVFRLTVGEEHDVCGIGLVLGILPANALSPKPDYPVLFGGEPGHVNAAVGDQTGNDPLPDNAAHLSQGITVEVYGKRFGVNDVDLAHRTVTLTQLC
jgi:hypothetical protein